MTRSNATGRDGGNAGLPGKMFEAGAQASRILAGLKTTCKLARAVFARAVGAAKTWRYRRFCYSATAIAPIAAIAAIAAIVARLVTLGEMIPDSEDRP